MQKIFFWIATVLQILFLVLAYGIQIFSMKKMGVMRYVVSINHKWEELYSIHILQYIIIGILTLLAIINIMKIIRMKKDGSVLGKMTLPMAIMLLIITTAFILFTLAFSTESYRSYYFISLILAIVTLIQNLKIFVYLKK